MAGESLALIPVAFVAATIFPLSSELALVAAITAGVPIGEAVIMASIGNCLGVAFNYWLGRWSRVRWLERYITKHQDSKSIRLFEKYGKWSMLLSWLPIVGDPLTILAGVGRVPIGFFAVTAFGTRILRYLLIAGFF